MAQTWIGGLFVFNENKRQIGVLYKGEYFNGKEFHYVCKDLGVVKYSENSIAALCSILEAKENARFVCETPKDLDPISDYTTEF